jgi:glycine dehydrogenase
MYAVYHGPQGLMKIARQVHAACSTLASGLRQLGWRIPQTHFFDTVTLAVGERQADIFARAARAGINLRRVEGSPAAIGISCDETTTAAIIESVWRAFGSYDGAHAAAQAYDEIAPGSPEMLPASLRRQSTFLTHPVFNRHHSETEMLRYLRRLADRDLALDRSMIPLGSCTMKLNGTTEMMPLTWPEFANLHPFAPADQAEGYAELIGDLAEKLRAITGFDAISLQPNSGAQGEYAGLLVIRAYHRSKGEGYRTICLIPSSAHGTNPASAHMAGMEVVVVKCGADGNVEVEDLRAKAQEHARALGALMITYPSTHGVFEPGIRAICDIVHSFGGQVYLDGANLNAQVGLARPADYGADVGHINLHKTFCIPHGGGGPGMGPIGVKAHLAPFLPGHPQWQRDARQIGPVSASPFGSGSILSISWIYILLMGGSGLTAASQAAILNANYIAARLAKDYPLLFKGQKGRVAHECILDVRHFKESAGVSPEDIAKRLIDYGFHAPTMSFPVPGTLMIEPTESEGRAELDRFCDAMIAIRGEIRAIEAGEVPREDNMLRNAPHTVLDLADEKWVHPYSRMQACFPMPALRRDKYWAPVNRLDNAYGDRHPICTCPMPAELEDAAA